MPHPRYVGQTTSALAQVGFPVPPARVELIPPRPGDATVWLDGEWAWSGSGWVWAAGRWVLPPAGAVFSPWTTVRDARGNVYFAGGVWLDAAGKPIPPPAPLDVGRSRAGRITSPEGDDERTAVGVNPPSAGSPP